MATRGTDTLSGHQKYVLQLDKENSKIDIMLVLTIS
jgi:hypothetical protein